MSDLKRSTEWYKELFGLKPEREGKDLSVLAFDNSTLVLRPGGTPGRIGHFCFGVKDFTKTAAEPELRKRGLDPRPDNDSFHVKDPDGLDVQISTIDGR